jgi:diguanylate cyclase (GGDEF)-like protein
VADGDPGADGAERLERAADQRDVAGDRRDQRGDRRDEAASRRDEAAADRDRTAQRRDADLGRAPRQARGTVDASNGGAPGHGRAAEDRHAREAAADRTASSADRTAAADDRGAALHDRAASASERKAASRAVAGWRAEQATHAVSDPLTGLANHSVFRARLDWEVERAHRHERPLSLAVVDVDAFKGRNDVFGHQAGDAVLVAVARHLEGTVRGADLVARIGGDEFAVLMPETAADAAEAMAERAHDAIRSDAADGLPGVTVSIGICDMQHAATAEDLLRHADGALYWAKANGRDAVWRYSPEAIEDLSFEQRSVRLARLQALAGVRTLARAIDAKDHSTQLHSERVASLAARIGEALGWEAERVAALHEAALVHDVGKIGVPDALLLKPSRLEPAEYEAIKAHAALGAQIAAEVLSPEQATWVRQHHERHDGGGYPDGLTAEDISDGAKVLAVADSWDVMTSERAYAHGMPVTEALAECGRCAGHQFAPDVVAVLTSPGFERTLRIFANEQAARHGNEIRLEGAPEPVFTLRCECGLDDCTAHVHVPAPAYRVIRLHARRYIVHPGHELPNDERVLSQNDHYNVVEKS